MATSIEITGLTKDGGSLTKSISLAPDGSVKSDGSACVMSKGEAVRTPLGGVADLAAVIAKMKSKHAIALGALRADLPDTVQVVTKGKLNGLPHVIARTASSISYRPGVQAFVLIDIDTKAMPDEVRERIRLLGGYWNALVAVLPELSSVAHIIRPSTSAGLFRRDTGEELPSSGGRHVYLLVKDGADIVRFLDALHCRCWLAGFGWMMVGRAGQLLERSIVDRMVGAPERLVFEGPPILTYPLAQDLDKRQAIVVEGGMLDTIICCPPLRLAELVKLKEARAKEWFRLKSESDKARLQFRAERIKAMIGRGVAADAAEKVVERQCRGILLPTVVLPFDDCDLDGKTVADVLADPLAFEGETLADPLEGVDYGRNKAKIMLRPDGTLWIHSFAHGYAAYELKLDAAAVRATINAAKPEKVVETFARMALNADTTPVETEELRDLVAKLSGVNKRTIDRTLKEALNEQRKQKIADEQERRLAERRDPRPQVDVPDYDAESLPRMELLDNVLSASNAVEPPLRGIDLDGTEKRMLIIPKTHAFSTTEVNEEEDE
jgi:hypothetical protein